MKFGSREIANVVFRAKQRMKFGKMIFEEKQPVLYIDTAKTSSVEGAADAVYANGGRGNPRLITWEGNKTVTVTVEDALLSPVSFAILSGAGLIHGAKDTSQDVSVASEKTGTSTNSVESTAKSAAITNAISSINTDLTQKIDGYNSSLVNLNIPFTVGAVDTDSYSAGDFLYMVTITCKKANIVEDGETGNYTATIVVSYTASKTKIDSDNVEVHVHKTVIQEVVGGQLDLRGALVDGKDVICKTAPIFIMEVESDGSLTGGTIPVPADGDISATAIGGLSNYEGQSFMVDFYVTRSSADVYELQINAEDFAGAFYVEAETLFRRQDTQNDLPAIFTLPNVKIQSNWTFSMSADGDPSTFTFTMDASPDYTYFDKTKKMLCVIQIVDDDSRSTREYETVMGHSASEHDYNDN